MWPGEMWITLIADLNLVVISGELMRYILYACNHVLETYYENLEVRNALLGIRIAGHLTPGLRFALVPSVTLFGFCSISFRASPNRLKFISGNPRSS